MIRTLESRRFFPTIRWAWPAGGLDKLLLAAACPDEGRARAALDAWLDDNDINAVEFRDLRLLATITDRFGTALVGRPEEPRLAGLQRQLWTRSRMAIAQAATALRPMVNAGIPVMLLKGAARIAAEPDSARRAWPTTSTSWCRRSGLRTPWTCSSTWVGRPQAASHGSVCAEWRRESAR